MYNVSYAKKRKKRNKRWINLDELCHLNSPFPFVAILRGRDGSTNHAVTIVDDIIFDSTLEYAMKLRIQSFHWICGIGGCDGIHTGIHFNDNYNYKKRFVRECKKNW